MGVVVTTRARLLAWLWLIAVAIGGAVGMAGAYRDPGLLRIDAFAEIYTAAGLSDRLMISVLLVLPLVGAIGTTVVILIIRGTERAATVFAVCLVATYFYMSGASLGIPVAWFRDLTASLSVVLFAGFLVLFPTATMRPRWSVAAPAMALALVIYRPDIAAAARAELSSPGSVGDTGLVAASLATILTVALASQVVRYRSVSSTIERYQTRWVVAALSLMLVPPSVVFALFAVGLADSAAVGYLVLISAVGSLVFPVAVAVATFRYHLYEIDRIISRTLTYASVALVVSAVYVGIVVGLPTLVGTRGEIYVAGGTLAAAAAFNPARRRIQTAIDRRFNRARYDSHQELSDVSSRMGAAANLKDLEAELTGVLSRTVQPSSVDVWFVV